MPDHEALLRGAKLWPVSADSSVSDTDIRKLNHTGTHPVHTDLAIANAIAFHETIGIQRKEARLRHLQNYWTSRVRGTRNIVSTRRRIPTSLDARSQHTAGQRRRSVIRAP